ncbi:hypothetical protein [Micromonospora sp. CPCC 206061]|uniref:hypothetical protein n=1 Tax=Micromonospora sp. CPCC 206061 TaxID=3122410 RepID=UPI002FF1A02D
MRDTGGGSQLHFAVSLIDKLGQRDAMPLIVTDPAYSAAFIANFKIREPVDQPKCAHLPNQRRHNIARATRRANRRRTTSSPP